MSEKARIFSREEAEQHRAEWEAKFGDRYDVIPILHATIEALAEALNVAIPKPNHPTYKTLREKGWIQE